MTRLVAALASFALACPAFPASAAQDIPTDPTPKAIGGQPPGKYDARFRANQPADQARTALNASLAWLAAHQSPDGSWAPATFHLPQGVPAAKHADTGTCGCTGTGAAKQNVGITGLALLAFLGDGNTTAQGPYKMVLARGIEWLCAQQDEETGLIGSSLGSTFAYDHAIASLALIECCHISKSPTLRSHAVQALRYIEKARNPYGAWRYDVPPVGDNDTSITAWMTMAIKTAEDAKFKIDSEAYVGTLNWLDEVTETKNGRVGYSEKGSTSSRVPGVNEHFPTDAGEAMTAAGLLCRTLLGQNPEQKPIMKRHADLLLRALPEWDPGTFGCDMYYWFYGSHAMFQMGGTYWAKWKAAMVPALLDSQRTEGHLAGSWDPVGPWGYSGGRVYATALLALCLEAEYRYRRVLGG